MSDLSRPDSGPPLVAVYEAINDSLRETYLGTTELPEEAVAEGFRRTRPSRAAHWEERHAVTVNIVERGLRLHDARDFLTHYAASLEAVGWKTLREDS
ncbi:MAG: hypothetical protein HYX59_14310 [Elusimicrobia bacterium]|nr:hypothetical protein [Elusimicrobiota bacterium]